MNGQPRPAADHEVLLRLRIFSEQEVFALRRHGRTACRLLGLEGLDQVRLVTSLSELGRALLPAPLLRVSLAVRLRPTPLLVAEFTWDGGEVPPTGALEAVGRLVAHLDVRGAEGVVAVGQPLPDRGGDWGAMLEGTRRALDAEGGASAQEESNAQTRDLIAALEEARSQQEELRRLNEELENTNQGVLALYTELSAELERTNQGVVALYSELEDKSRQLREASEAKTRFWANVSHELRSPVNAVIGLARLLLTPADAAAPGQELTEEQRRQVSLIAGSGATLLALVEELLDVAKAESGRLEPQWGPVDLRALLLQLRGTVQGTVDRPQVTLIVPGGPETAVPGLVTDEVMLTRILRNLLSNSVKFTETGEVRLSLATRETPEGTRLLLTVSDTGVGIPPEEQDKIFEEFYQVRGVHQRGRPGTGLGLPYARRLSELLGGTLRLESTPGRGTTARVDLPLAPAEGLAAAHGAEPDPPRLAKLVAVDDDPAFLATLRPTVRRLADLVVEVTEPSEALDTIRAQRPSAVVLDLQMPGPDGYEILAALAADPELSQTPVIVVTAAERDSLDHERLAPARAVLDKASVSLRTLSALIHGRRSAHEGVAERP